MTPQQSKAELIKLRLKELQGSLKEAKQAVTMAKAGLRKAQRQVRRADVDLVKVEDRIYGWAEKLKESKK